MKKTIAVLLTGWLVAGVSIFAQTPANPQQTAKLKATISKALNDAIREFENNNDQESGDFASSILTSLNQPGGLAPTALAADGQRMKERVRQLVKRNALESAAVLNWAQWQVLRNAGLRRSMAPNSTPKTGGTPGPGGLVLYLPFDKPDVDGVVHDESGAGNDGHVFGAQWVPGGRFGGAYQFRITNLTDRIVIPNSDTLSPDNITISAWIKTADRDGFWNRVADKDCENGYCLDLGGDYYGKGHRGKLQIETSAGALETPRVLDDNRWHHVAATFDGRTLCTYIDGSGPTRTVRNPGPLKKNGWDLCIGNSVVGYAEQDFLAFDGLIDEVRIYNRALSADDIKALAGATHAGADILPPAADAAKPDATERLKKIKTLYDQGLISKEDYDKKVKEIMDSL